MTTTRAGYPDGSATVSGTALKQCTLKVKAKKASYKMPKNGTTKVVTSAKAGGPKCSLKPAAVEATPLGKSGSAKVAIDRLSKGALKVTTFGKGYKVTATYTAKSSKDGVVKATWTRTWQTK